MSERGMFITGGIELAAAPYASSERPIRKRNKAQTRESILRAARTMFAEKGFGEAGIREITRVAGVNESLVSRYFGSKDRLFAEAVLQAAGTPPAAMPRADTPSENTRPGTARFFTLGPDAVGPETLSAIVRSTASEDARDAIKLFLQLHAIDPLKGTVASERGAERAALIVALILGVHMLMDVFGIDALVGTDAQTLRELADAMIAAAADCRCNGPSLAPASG